MKFITNLKNNLARTALTLLLATLTTRAWASSIPGALPGRFTINASGEKIVFSQGNLQYVGTWQFAEHQWDCFSASQYNDHRDLFGWGTGDAPNKVSTNNGDYGTFTDWGTNAITNGGNKANVWRTLTKDEWVYLFYSRENAATLFGFGSVNGVNGLIILPDNWSTPEGASFTASTTLGLTDQGSYYHNGNNNNYTHNTYTAEQWTVMESSGAVFLPAAAYRHGADSNIYYTEIGGFYWSATPSSSADKAYYLNFYTNDLDPQFNEMRYGGRPVRLVKASLDQDNEGYYLIGSLQDWQDFAALVNGGNTNINARMTADIDLGDDQTHIGSLTQGQEPYYAGVFDGQGHTLTVNYVGGGNQIVAPFTHTNGGTIKNLHVAGSIQSAFAYIGVVGMAGGNSVISNVWMSATMQTSQSGWVQSAAIAGYCDGTIQDCLFTGTFTSGSSGYMGGFYGYTNGSPTVTNCLSTGTFNNGNWQGNGIHTNCYLKQYPTGLTSGCSWATDETLADGSIAYQLQNNRSDLVWGQRIGTDAAPVLTNDQSYRVYRCINGGYTNNPDLAYTGLEQDAEDYYLLGNLLDWQEFASLVNSGTTNANARMTADIDLGDEQTMVGKYATRYSGIFDGQGHTLTINYNTSSMSIESGQAYLGAAPFRDIEGATIRNVHTAGNITVDKIGASGLVGWAYGTNTIENCWSDVNLVSSNGTADTFCGFVAFLYGSSINIKDCIFTGLIQSTSKQSHSGFIGYHNSGTSVLTNCLVILDEGSDASRTSPCGVMYFTFDRFACGDQSGGTYTNCFYYRDFGVVQGTKVTDEQLSNGTIAYQLQNNRGDLVWGQRIGIDTAPVLTSDESYRVYYINGSYTNDPDPAIPCSDPTELSVTQTSYTSFTLAWTAGNSVAWDVQYRAIGALSWTSFGTVNVATCTLTDLEESTPYEAQVKATCSDTWVSFDNFTTSEIPAAIDVDLDHPFSVNFASLSAIPDNWIAVGWTLEANSYIYSGNTGTCYLYSPVLNITTGGKIRVYSRTETINYSGNSSHTLTILATTDGGNTFEEATIPASAAFNIEPSIYSYNIPSSWIGKQLQIVFKYETPGVGVNRWDIHEVDINVGTIFQNNNYNYDGNWTSSQNWTNGIPNENIDAKIIADVNIRTGHYVAAHNITISTGVTLTLYNNSSLTCNEITNNGTIVIQDGGQLICNNNPTVTMQKSITGYGNNNEVKTGWNFIASPITEELSPSSEFMLWNTYDLYRLNNTTWENYRAHTQDFTINNGKGYLYANSGNVTLSFTGTIKPFTTESNANQVALTDGWNLVGNPYTFNVYSSKSYYKITTTTIDNVEQNVVTAVTSPSNYIAPCTGIVVKSTGIGSVAFTKTAPAEWSTGNQGNIQMTLAQQATNRGSAATIDNAIVSFNEGSLLGKFYFGTQKANLYIPQGTEEYAIAYSDGQGEMPVNFRANENGQYTITVNPEGVEMAYLHLIDNMTGADVDLLQTSEYTFNAKVTDYESRFRLVFVCGDANDDNGGDNESFAFFSNGNWIIANEGQATLQVIDITGRILSSETINGSVSKGINQPAGVYMIRLINGDHVKMQKIVVR